MSRALQLAGKILEIARREGVQPGERLYEYRLAQRLGVSRGPVRSGLKELVDAGLATTVPNKGFVLLQSLDSDAVRETVAAAPALEQLYLQIAGDRLDGGLPDVVSENELMRRYSVTRPDLVRLLNRIASEGWAERLPGYGWKFAETLSTPDAYEQTTRFRMMIEPAAIREPKFKLDVTDADRIREQQQRVLDGGYKTFTFAEMFRLGCEFHETIAKASGNPFVLSSLKRVNSLRRLYTYRAVLPDHTTIIRQAGEHLRLLDMIVAGRRGEAAGYMVWHLKDIVGER